MGIGELSGVTLCSWVRAARILKVTKPICETDMGVKAVGWWRIGGSEVWNHGTIGRVWGEVLGCGS